MENKHPINDLISTAVDKVRAMADVNTLIGEPIQVGEVTLIPVSKLSFGLAPVAFLIVKGANVRLLPASPAPGTSIVRVIEMVPDVVDKVTGFIEKQQEKKSAQN